MCNKVKIINIISAFLIIISIILNIMLLTTKLFHGTYTANIDSTSSPYKLTQKLRIYDNSYTLTTIENDKYAAIEVGFYIYMPKSKYNKTPTSKDIKYDSIALLEFSDYSHDQLLYRRSVFRLTYETYDYSQNEPHIVSYYCKIAIFLLLQSAGFSSLFKKWKYHKIRY